MQKNHKMDSIRQLIDWAFDLSDILQSIFGIFSIYGIYSFFKEWMPQTVNLSIGSFTIKRKYFDVQNITNIVSAKFYDGGKIPPEVRREIIDLTCPTIKKLKSK